MPSKQPERLRRGKTFHRKLQLEWVGTAQGTILPEKTIRRLTKRRGRIDIFVADDSGENHVAVVEIKGSDWDQMNPEAVSRNAIRQVRQIWSYIYAQVELEGKDVSPGIIFPNRPSDLDRLRTIEQLFNDHGIQVVWHDETMEELKERMKAG